MRTVNDRQLTVLTWIGDGCPNGVMGGDTYKSSAAALRSRRLVTITKRAGTWHAELTDAGRHFLDHGTYPSGHWEDRRPRGRSATRRPALTSTTGKPPVEQMIDDVVAAGGRLFVDGQPRSYWNSLVSSAVRYKKVPVGKVLSVERGDSWETSVLVLADAPDWMSSEPRPVPLSDQLRRPHPIVDAIRTDTRVLPMYKPLRARALRILNALAREAERRGYLVRAGGGGDGRGHSRQQFEIVIRQHGFGLFLDEQLSQVPHVLTAEERRSQERYAHSWAPKYDSVPTGRLRLRVINGPVIHVDMVADGKVRRLEDQLAAVLWEVELRANAADERQRLAQLEAQDRQRRWAQVRAEAEEDLRHENRASILHDQVRRWRDARDLDVYLDAVQERLADLAGPDKDDAAQWLAWGRSHRDRLDPLRGRLRMPVDPDITATALAPHMKGMSPYGP